MREKGIRDEATKKKNKKQTHQIKLVLIKEIQTKVVFFFIFYSFLCLSMKIVLLKINCERKREK